MKKITLISFICLCLLTSMIGIGKASKAGSASAAALKNMEDADNAVLISSWIDSLYDNMQLSALGLTKEAFQEGCKGYEYLLSADKLSKNNLLTIADYSKSSTAKRLFVIDMQQAKVLYNTYVSHGRNSGSEFATSFSNSNDSHKTSLGFMTTAETYNGGNGYSLRLDGLEKNINSNVRMRDIVMHGSNYVNEDRAVNGSMMGRSYGCPAVPAIECKKIIDCIKGGSCFFAYYPDRKYATASSILKADFVWPVLAFLKQQPLNFSDSVAGLQYFASGKYPAVKVM